MTETRFNLIFEDKVQPGHDQDAVRLTLESLFQFGAEDQARLFSGEPIVLGANLDAATAESFQQALAGAGATTRLVNTNAGPAVEAVPERRSVQRRSRPTRRARIRTGAIQPDRREGQDRRR